MLTGTLVNTGTVIAGSLIGILLGNILPERLRDTVMKGLGLCTLFIGISGMLGGENALITIISMAVGAVIGELLDLDGHLNHFAETLEKRFQRKSGGLLRYRIVNDEPFVRQKGKRYFSYRDLTETR